jgi:hypothetical protein
MDTECSTNGENSYVSALGSNSVRGMDVSLRLYCVCAVPGVCASIQWADPPSKGYYHRFTNLKNDQGPTEGRRAILNEYGRKM